MKHDLALVRIFALLVFVALVLAPFGGSMASVRSDASGSMSGMGMAGMDGGEAVDAMSCCPDAPPAAADGHGKPACPSASACTQQCIPAMESTAEPEGVAQLRDTDKASVPGDVFASLQSRPPPRPPRA